MDKLSKYWPLFIGVAGACIGVFGWFFQKGAETQNINGRIFDSPEQKVEVVKAYEESPTPEQKQRAYFLDSINKAHAIKSRAKRDSLFLLLNQRLEHLDSINLLNADQMYQIKEQLKNR